MDISQQTNRYFYTDTEIFPSSQADISMWLQKYSLAEKQLFHMDTEIYPSRQTDISTRIQKYILADKQIIPYGCRNIS